MGLSVISSMPKGVSPTASLQNNALAEGVPGDFAALLSGEILGAEGLVAELSGKALAATGLEKYPQLSAANGVGLEAAPQSRHLAKELSDKSATTLSEALLGAGKSLAAPLQSRHLAKELTDNSASTLSEALLGAGKLLAPPSQNRHFAKELPDKSAATLSEALLGTGKSLTAPLQNHHPAKELSDKTAATPSEALLGAEKAPAPTGLEEYPQALINDDTQGAIASLPDPSMLVSLTGNPALQPEITVRGSIGIQVSTDKSDKRIAEFSAATDTSLDIPAEHRLKTKGSEDLGVFEKLISATPHTGQSGEQSNETANFAAEHAPLETTNTGLTNTIGPASATKQSHDALAANQSSIQPHLRDSSWSQQFGEKIVWLAKNDQQTARININPPELGPVQITLSLNGDQAKLAFSSPHAEVRQAIEGALPQLKEMLSSAGISLGQTNVGANLTQQNPDNPYHAANAKHLADENAILPANDKALSTSTSSVLLRGRGLVDLFA